MKSLCFTLFLWLLLLSGQLSAQQSFFYKRGSLQLPNADLQNGLVLMPHVKTDSLDFLYFRKDEYAYPVKYYADQIISVDIIGESRRFLSVLLPGDSAMERRIAELHFDGEYKLLSVFEKRGEVFYISDRSGRLIKLENSYDPPSAENNFTVTYKYEYRAALSSLFGAEFESENLLAGIRYRSKDIAKFLRDYHASRQLPYRMYPPPSSRGYAGVSGGASIITSVNPDNNSRDFNSLFAFFGLSGQLDSYSGPLFLRAGIAGYRGSLFHDVEDNSFNDYIIFLEENIDVTLLNFNLNVGVNLFTIDNFRPYISSGIGYYGYSRFRSSVVKETLIVSEDIVLVTLLEDDKRPSGFAGILLEAGTNYNLRSGSRLQVGASYNHFLNKGGFMKSGTFISVSYQHKLF